MWRFSIRDLLFLTLLVAISLMWWLDRRRLQGASDELRQANEKVETENRELLRQLQPIRLKKLDEGLLMDPAALRTRMRSRIPAKTD